MPKPWEILEEDTIKKGKSEEEEEEEAFEGEETPEEEEAEIEAALAKKKAAAKKVEKAAPVADDDEVAVGTLEELVTFIEDAVNKALSSSEVGRTLKSLQTEVTSLRKGVAALKADQAEGFTYLAKGVKAQNQRLAPVVTMAKAVMDEAEEKAMQSAAATTTPPVTDKLAEEVLSKATAPTPEEASGAAPTIAEQIKLLEKAEILRDDHGLLVATSEDYLAGNRGGMSRERYDAITKAIAETGKL